MIIDHLNNLLKPNTVMAFGRGMETGVIVANDTDRVGVVDRHELGEMLRGGWIEAISRPDARVVKYQITDAGRGHTADAIPNVTRKTRRRYGNESSLDILARRKDRDGQPFLSRKQYDAAHRFTELYEVEAETVSRDMLTKPPKGDSKIHAALYELGEGLGDVTLRVCGRNEGMEAVERDFGWAARSGKIVLRIALQRLAAHFETHDDGMIG